ncbi:MAG: TnpV protein, partial [Clostridia bacterium]|nr:TnpV protein [Clostridia bacterium]
LALPEQTSYPLVKYANLRLDFMKKHRRCTYTTLLTSCTFNHHLYDLCWTPRVHLAFPWVAFAY